MTALNRANLKESDDEARVAFTVKHARPRCAHTRFHD